MATKQSKPEPNLYRAIALQGLKNTLDPSVIHDGPAAEKPFNNKELLAQIPNLKSFLELAAYHHIYTDGRFAFRLPPASVLIPTFRSRADDIVSEDAEADARSVKHLLARLDEYGSPNDEVHPITKIKGISDYGHYLLEAENGLLLKANGRMYETLIARCNIPFEVFAASYDKPIVFRNEQGEWMGIMMPFVSEEGPPGDVVIPQDRWGFYQYQEFGMARAIFGKQHTKNGIATIDGLFLDIFTEHTAKFSIEHRKDLWGLWMHYGERGIDVDLIAQFEFKKKAIAAVNRIADHVAMIDWQGRLYFSNESTVYDHSVT